jgi:hypothetical protein
LGAICARLRRHGPQRSCKGPPQAGESSRRPPLDNTNSIEAENFGAPRDLLTALARYRQPNHLRSLLELTITKVSLVVLWLAAWWALGVSY